MTKLEREKLCMQECHRLGWDFIGISNDGYSDIVAWHRSGDDTYGYHTYVNYNNGEKASFYNGVYNLSFTELCSEVLDRIVKMTKKTIKENKYA